MWVVYPFSHFLWCGLGRVLLRKREEGGEGTGLGGGEGKGLFSGMEKEEVMSSLMFAEMGYGRRDVPGE